MSSRELFFFNGELVVSPDDGRKLEMTGDCGADDVCGEECPDLAPDFLRFGGG
jgi:hypothetical protein